MKSFAQNLIQLRRQYNMTQEQLANKLNISSQAVSKWETGQSLLDIIMLPKIADIFRTSIDSLISHSLKHNPSTQYEEFYRSQNYYWGITPNHLCYEILKLKPPIKPWRLLDIGCGEGKDAVFFARNGYQVDAFDITKTGLDKAEKLASFYNVQVNFFQADINSFRPNTQYDIIFSSGVLHYLKPDLKERIIHNYKHHTAENGLNVFNVFIDKPFLSPAPDEETPHTLWYSGELAILYHDWYFHQFYENIFDCISNNIPHKHCMNTIIAEKVCS